MCRNRARSMEHLVHLITTHIIQRANRAVTNLPLFSVVRGVSQNPTFFTRTVPKHRRCALYHISPLPVVVPREDTWAHTRGTAQKLTRAQKLALPPRNSDAPRPGRTTHRAVRSETMPFSGVRDSSSSSLSTITRIALSSTFTYGPS